MDFIFINKIAVRTTQKQETPINIHTHTTHTDFKTEYYGRIQGYKQHTHTHTHLNKDGEIRNE